MSDVREVFPVSDMQSLTAFNDAIPVICQRACGQIFAFYRGIINLRESLKAKRLDEPFAIFITMKLAPAQKMVESFELTYGAWVNSCLDCFAQMSAYSQISVGMIPSS